MFKSFLKKTIEGKTLSRQEAKEAMDLVMGGEVTESQLASLLTVLRFRGETVEEMTGFTESLRAHAQTIEHNMDVIDTCGTGGDGASTYNISTATALLLASMGVKVAKHGNRAMSSKSGSADALEALGIPIQHDPVSAIAALREDHMCFLYAPLYHASMKYAAPARREIGFRTIFNILGPLANPARCRKQLIGVFDEKIAVKMAETLQKLGTERAVFVTGENGLDECSISGQTALVVLENGAIRCETITPEDVGLRRGKMEDLIVHSARESAELIQKIFAGTASQAATDILYLNAGTALYAAGVVGSIAEGVHEARKTVENGVSARHLKRLRQKGDVSRHASAHT